MTPALNPVLFILSTLFGLQTLFVAEQTNLSLDLESKKVVIEYLDLKTPEENIEFAEEGLSRIANTQVFGANLPGIKLESKSFEKKVDTLNVRLTFSFENQDELLKLLRFNLNLFGEQDSSNAIHYHLLSCENSKFSNGKKIDQDGITILEWEKGVKQIDLRLTQNPKAKKLLGNLKSLAEYWEK